MRVGKREQEWLERARRYCFRARLTGADIVESIPDLREVAEVEVGDFAAIESYAITGEHMRALAQEAIRAFDEGCDGVVRARSSRSSDVSGATRRRRDGEKVPQLGTLVVHTYRSSQATARTGDPDSPGNRSGSAAKRTRWPLILSRLVRPSIMYTSLRSRIPWTGHGLG